MTTITIPSRRIQAIDLLDDAIADLRTIHCAMNDPSGIDDDALRALASVLWGALRKLQPVREKVNQ